jgi:hypothetical protein
MRKGSVTHPKLFFLKGWGNHLSRKINHKAC